MAIALFGRQAYLCFLQDIEITGPQGERLALCYKFSIYCFFVPLWLRRDGYVLGIIETNQKGTKLWLAKTFYPLTSETINQYQTSKHLPKPLPHYLITFGDSWPVGVGWIITGVGILIWFVHG